MSCDVLVVGAGPLPTKNSTLTCSYNLRTAKLVSWLGSQGLKIRTVAVDIFNSSACKTPQCLPSLAGEYLLLANDAHAEASFAELIETENPTCILAVSYQASDLACRVNHQLPVWADMPGWILAEAQLSAAIHGSDRGIAEFAEKESRVLSRADKISVVSLNQRHATMGELGLLGRLNRRNQGHNLVHRLPSLAFDWTPLLPRQNQELPTLFPEASKVVLWSGTYNVWTDIERIFALTERILEKLPQVHYVSTGGRIARYNDPLCNRFEQLVETSLFRERYHVLPWLGFSEALSWFKRADLGLCIDGTNVEIDYGSRTRLVDMLSHGLAAASTPCTEIAQDLASAGKMISLDPAQPESGAQQIQELLCSPEKLGELSSQGRDYIFAHYGLSSVGQELLAWLRDPRPAPDMQFRHAISVNGFLPQPPLPNGCAQPFPAKDSLFWNVQPLVIWQPQEQIEASVRRVVDPHPPGRLSRALQRSMRKALGYPLSALGVLGSWSMTAPFLPPVSQARWQSRIEQWLLDRKAGKLSRNLARLAGRPVYAKARAKAASFGNQKAFNVLLARHEYDRTQGLTCRPQRIEIEPSSVCNIRCHMCSRNVIKGSSGFMEPATFDKLLPYLPTTASFEIVGAGEPTLNPNLPEFIAQASHFDCFIRMFTNATRLTPQLCAQLVTSQVGCIVFSLPAGDDPSYRRVTGFDGFSLVTENMRTLRDVRRCYRSTFPRFQMNCALTTSALESAPEVVRLASEMNCDDLSFSVACIFDPELESESLLSLEPSRVLNVFSQCLETAKQLGIKIHLPAYPPKPLADSCNKVPPNRFGCLLPWQSMLVRATGLVEVCTYNRKIVGDLHSQSLDEIWNGTEFARFRANQVTHNGVNYCESCYHRAGKLRSVSSRSHLAFSMRCDGYR